MKSGTTAIPFVTPGERIFLRHFNAETFEARRGPALAWLADQGLDWNGMAVFQRWAARHDDRSVLGIDEDSLPPFEVPWGSREDFLSRVSGSPGGLSDLRPLMRSSIKSGVSA